MRNQKENERKRVVTWEDPKIAARALRDMTGLEWLEAITKEKLPRPPISELLGYRFVEFEPGRAVFKLPPGEWLYNPIGMVHGGVVTTVLDSAMGCAIHTMLDKGAVYSTLELKVNFISPARSDSGLLKAEGRKVHIGGRTAIAEGRLTDDQDNLYALATATFLIIQPDKTTPAP